MNAKAKKYTFEELLKTHSPEELAEAYVFPVTLTPEEREAAAAELVIARKRNEVPFTDEDKLKLKLIRLRYLIESYIQSGAASEQYNFGYFLKEYITILNKKRKQFAADIDIDPTLLSQLIHQKRDAPEYVYFRLEIHSNNMIPADYWYRAAEKQREHKIKTDKLSRKKQQAFVHNKISVTL